LTTSVFINAVALKKKQKTLMSVIAGATGPVGDTGSTATTGPAHTG